MKDFDDRLAWIFGSSRSGSTWLLRMLSELDRAIPIDDPHIGHHLGVWRPIALAWATSDEMPELRTLSDFKRDKPDYFFSERYRDDWMPALRDLIRTRFESQARDEAARRGIADPIVLVKEPASHVADWLLDMFPSSRLIFLLRDGRDVVDSWLDAYSDGSWATGEGAYPLSERGRLSLIRWQASVWLRRTEVVQEAYARHHPERRVLVRYEDLRQRPVAELTRICPVLGFDPPPARIEQVARGRSYEQVPEAEKGSKQEIRSAKPGGWRETMSAEEVAVMHEILGPKLDQLGYLGSGDAATDPVPVPVGRRPRRRPAA